MIKKMLLVFLCFTLFLSIPGCKKKLPTQPDVQPLLVLPTIAYFTASPSTIKLGEYSTLAWSTTNATIVTISGEGVSATGTMDVSPPESRIYTLKAKNNDGQITSECTVMISRWAEVVVNTIPPLPVFYYYPTNNSCYSDFAVVVTEINGVGGRIDNMYIDSWESEYRICTRKWAGSGTFSANGSFTTSVLWVFASCKAMFIEIIVRGIDIHDYTIDQSVWFTITWSQNIGIMKFWKIVEGQNHHKLIN